MQDIRADLNFGPFCGIGPRSDGFAHRIPSARPPGRKRLQRFTLLLALLAPVQSAHAAVGLRVSEGRLLEANGEKFIMRGVSHPHVWYPGETGAFADIKSLGANTVRVVLSSGQRWAPNSTGDVANVISLCKQNRLICVLEVHDTTGFDEEKAAATLDQAVDYWISIQNALTGQENYIVLNIGNEPYGNNNASAWTAATINAIGRLRSAGFDHLIMADAPNWGQDWQFVMRDNASSIFKNDPDRNTVFSIHMYDVFDTASEITNYMSAFQTAGLPLVVGEFGHQTSDGGPDEDTIMAQAQARAVGYLGWSWSGNSSTFAYLDIANNFNANSLTAWGQRIFNGANGIAQTAREAAIYGGSSTDTPTRTPAPRSPTPAMTPTGTPHPTATHTDTATPGSPTPPETPNPCCADCDEDGRTSINELVLAVNIALGNQPAASCPASDCDHGGRVTVDELIRAVNAALQGCASRSGA